jgi:hypothetical protein
MVVQAKYWLPLQLATYASIIYWAIPCHVSATAGGQAGLKVFMFMFSSGCD